VPVVPTGWAMSSLSLSRLSRPYQATLHAMLATVALAMAVLGCLAFAGTAGAATLSWSSPIVIAQNGGQEEGGSQELSLVACPSTSQCTAISTEGEVTFNPTSPGTPTQVAFGEISYPAGVACPSTSQCTALLGGGEEVTFNPTSLATPTPVTISGSAVNGIACPSTSQCTFVGAG
jgi:hypothetical protein